MGHNEEFNRRVHRSRKSILTVQLFIMIIGVGIFTLGVISRPILRITRPDFIPTVKWIVNVMVGAGLIQIVAASYDIFSSCWKLMWPIYIGIAGTTATVFLELTAIAASIYLYTKSESVVNEDLVHPWYWVECLKPSTCHDRMLNYINWFILPQGVMAAVTVILQCITIIILGRLVRSIVEHHHVLHDAQERYHEEWEEKQFTYKQEQSIKPPPEDLNHNLEVETNAPDSTSADDGMMLRTPSSRRVQFSDTEMSPMGSARKRRGGDNMEMVHRSTYEAQIHAVVEMATPVTPRSILKEDHGYVAGSRVSLDIDKF